ncbi:MAG: Flp family type IVb pilin [Hyphomicrobiaceae bacterium]|nr:Flp family type IVb pilin [Hyphomicrobiaceae bacterium]
MKTIFAAFVNDESGATAIEYALITSLIAIALITAASNVGNGISNTFNVVKNNIK